MELKLEGNQPFRLYLHCSQKLDLTVGQNLKDVFVEIGTYICVCVYIPTHLCIYNATCILRRNELASEVTIGNS